jgi:hypothetical protein
MLMIVVFLVLFANGVRSVEGKNLDLFELRGHVNN